MTSAASSRSAWKQVCQSSFSIASTAAAVESSPMRFAALATCFALASCKLPDVNLATPKPIEVNLNMRLDVYQYSGDPPKDQAVEKANAAATDSMRNRASEIQTLKNNRLIGENHLGLLTIKELPAGTWGDYVKKTIDSENQDRSQLMREEAKKTQRSMSEVQAEQWKLRMEKAFKGEFVEVPGSTGDSYNWIQSEGPKSKAEEPKP
jgi:hypothetical protein